MCALIDYLTFGWLLHLEGQKRWNFKPEEGQRKKVWPFQISLTLF